MKYLLTDDAGKIVSVYTAGHTSDLALQINGVQLHTGVATQVHAVGREAGQIHDAHVFVGKDGMITAHPGHEHEPGAQHAGMAVHRLDPGLIATDLELIDDDLPGADPPDTTAPV